MAHSAKKKEASNNYGRAAYQPQFDPFLVPIPANQSWVDFYDGLLGPGWRKTFPNAIKTNEDTPLIFAALSGDDQEAHTNPDFCSGRFLRSIMQGLFGLHLAMRGADAVMTGQFVAIRCVSVTFHEPCFPGDIVKVKYDNYDEGAKILPFTVTAVRATATRNCAVGQTEDILSGTIGFARGAIDLPAVSEMRLAIVGALSALLGVGHGQCGPGTILTDVAIGFLPRCHNVIGMQKSSPGIRELRFSDSPMQVVSVPSKKPGRPDTRQATFSTDVFVGRHFVASARAGLYLPLHQADRTEKQAA